MIEVASGTPRTTTNMGWTRGAKKRPASGANLPGPRGLRAEEEEEEENYGIVGGGGGYGNNDDEEGPGEGGDDDFWDFDEEEDPTAAFAARGSFLSRSLLCGAWARWVVRQAVFYMRGHFSFYLLCCSVRIIIEHVWMHSTKKVYTMRLDGCTTLSGTANQNDK